MAAPGAGPAGRGEAAPGLAVGQPDRLQEGRTPESVIRRASTQLESPSLSASSRRLMCMTRAKRVPGPVLTHHARQLLPPENNLLKFKGAEPPRVKGGAEAWGREQRSGPARLPGQQPARGRTRADSGLGQKPCCSVRRRRREADRPKTEPTARSFASISLRSACRVPELPSGL